jgi:hypothetical protein
LSRSDTTAYARTPRVLNRANDASPADPARVRRELPPIPGNPRKQLKGLLSPGPAYPRSSESAVTCHAGVASPFVVFERDEVSSVAGSLLLLEASVAATAGAKRPT